MSEHCTSWHHDVVGAGIIMPRKVSVPTLGSWTEEQPVFLGGWYLFHTASLFSTSCRSQGKAGCTYAGSSPQNWQRKMLQDTTSCRRFENPEEKVIMMG